MTEAQAKGSDEAERFALFASKHPAEAALTKAAPSWLNKRVDKIGAHGRLTHQPGKPAMRNPVAKALRSPHLAARIVKSKKGKGAFQRRPRTPASGVNFVLAPVKVNDRRPGVNQEDKQKS